MRVNVLLLLLISFAVAVQAQPSAHAVPALDLKDIQGQAVRPADYNGYVVLLNFWATWCPPCRTEIPNLIKWQRTYRRQGLRVIGITYPPETMTDVLGFAKRIGINYRVALGNKETKSVFTNSENLPITVVLDREGKTRAVVEGIMYADEFAEKVKPLLVSRSATTSATHRPPRKSAVQRRRIEVTGKGYQPASVMLRLGVPAELTFVRTVEETCGREIVIPAYGINRPLPLNTPVAVTFTPKRPGRFKFSCGMNMFRGALVVK